MFSFFQGVTSNSSNSTRDTLSNGNSTPTTASVPKVFHNTRCTRHHKAHHSHSPNRTSNGGNGVVVSEINSHHLNGGHSHTHIHHLPSAGHRKKTESVLSTDSDIRFTRRKLGDSQKCGCAVIAGFLVALLVAGVFVYVGCEYSLQIQGELYFYEISGLQILISSRNLYRIVYFVVSFKY